MTMYKALHSRADIDGRYVSRKKEKEKLLASTKRLEGFIKKSKERLITVASNITNNIKANITIIKKKKWKDK